MFNTIKSFFLNDNYVKKIILFGFIYRLILSALYLSVTLYPMSNNFKFLTSILGNFAFEHYTGERTFGYPLFMAFCLNNIIAVMITQFFIGIITWVFWYKTLKNLNFSPKNSFLITLFTGSFIHIFFYETAVMYETLILFFVSWIFYLLSDGFLEKKNKKTDWLMFALVGYLTFIKPFFIFIPCLIYGFSVLKDFSFKKVFSHKIIVLFSGFLVYFGWSYVNKIHTGHFVSSTFFGLNTAQNCVHFAENTTDQYKELGQIYAYHREQTIRENKDIAMSIWYGRDDIKAVTGIDYFPDYSAYLGEYAKATIALNKEQYIKQIITISWVNFWDNEIHWDYLSFPNKFSETFFKTIWKIQYPILITFKVIFLLLIPLYLFRFLKTKKITFELITICIVSAASVLQAIVTFGNNARFSFPFEYLMIFVVCMIIKDIRNKILKK